MKFEFQQTVAPDQAEKINNTNKAYASKLEEQLNIIDHGTRSCGDLDG
jgi:hypothetical protein